MAEEIVGAGLAKPIWFDWSTVLSGQELAAVGQCLQYFLDVDFLDDHPAHVYWTFCSRCFVVSIGATFRRRGLSHVCVAFDGGSRSARLPRKVYVSSVAALRHVVRRSASCAALGCMSTRPERRVDSSTAWICG